MISINQKMALKITCGNTTKRVRELPESFDALKSTVKASFKATDKLVGEGHFAITYEDDTGDVINLDNNDDLLAAYDVAENHIVSK